MPEEIGSGDAKPGSERSLDESEVGSRVARDSHGLPALGTLIAGKYRIETVLDEGGMGVVFRARHELIDKSVALKCLLPQLARDERFRNRFIREVRAASRIHHPNVVDVYDVGVYDGGLFLVMELIEGVSFDRLLDHEELLPIRVVLRVLLDSMHAVYAAHLKNIVHRDIKPDNILVTFDAQYPDGFAKVLDFGISKLTDEPVRPDDITSIGHAIGTPRYMSVEQMNGAADLDARTDVYSFGVLLYRALTGRLPYSADTLPALAVAVATERPLPPSRLHVGLPTAFDRVVLKAMAVRREDRYQTLGELIEAVERLVPSALAASAAGEGQAQRRGSRSRATRLAGVGLAVSLAAGAVYAALRTPAEPLVQLRPRRAEAEDAPRPEPEPPPLQIVAAPAPAVPLAALPQAAAERRAAERQAAESRSAQPSARLGVKAARAHARRPPKLAEAETKLEASLHTKAALEREVSPLPNSLESEAAPRVATGQRSGTLRRDEL